MPENRDITDMQQVVPDIPEDLTVQDILDEANDSKYHSLLELWREILKSGREERHAPITPQWANRITSSYREINFADVPGFKEKYFDKIEELLAVVIAEIDEDLECLNVTSMEEDVERNAIHYRALLFTWQSLFLDWELNWDCTKPTAATDLAAISEAHRIIFDKTGITNLLDSINFQFTDSDRQMLADALQKQKSEREGQ